MNPQIFDKELLPYRMQMEEIVKELHQMTLDTGNDELAAIVSELRNTLQEPFLFVIVGEVKAGKSSFINALLATGKEVVKVAPDPCTDTIQQILYGEQEETVMINEHLKKILLPVEILKKISVVDTPGTNTISDHHQEITERFIPRSDLIVFVFEAKNPYRQSAWDFFDYIHKDWQKKIIFVLQQADLMNAEDLSVNMDGVTNYAKKKGILDPKVFALSAKLEQEGNHAESGFDTLNEYIRTHITGLNAYKLKLQSNVSTSRNVNGKISIDLQKMEKQLKTDRAFRVDIIDTLRNQEDRSTRQVDSLVKNLLDEYDLVTTKTQRELEEGLGFFSLTKKSFLSVFSKEVSPQEWLKSLTKNLELELGNRFNNNLQEGVEEIADSIGQMAKIIDLKIKNSQSVLTNQEDVFGEISERRKSVLRDLQDKFAQFMTHTENFVGTEVFPEASALSPNIAAGSGIAVIGVVLAAATQIAALDITGGILSAAGLLFAGGTVLLKRGKIIKGFAQEIDHGREQLKDEMDLKLKSYVQNIRAKIDKNFEEFDALLDIEKEHVEKIAQRHTFVGEQLDTMEEKLTSVK